MGNTSNKNYNESDNDEMTNQRNKEKDNKINDIENNKNNQCNNDNIITEQQQQGHRLKNWCYGNEENNEYIMEKLNDDNEKEIDENKTNESNGKHNDNSNDNDNKNDYSNEKIPKFTENTSVDASKLNFNSANDNENDNDNEMIEEFSQNMYEIDKQACKLRRMVNQNQKKMAKHNHCLIHEVCIVFFFFFF